jgi:hypothetical protein
VEAGDVSGRIVHPAIIHVSQLLGSLLWRTQQKTEVLVVSEDVELQSLLQALQNTPDPATLVMIYTLVSWYFYYQRHLRSGAQYLGEAAKVVLSHNLEFSPERTLTLGEPGEDTKEYITALTQLLYMDRNAATVLDAKLLLNPEYEKQFKELSVSTASSVFLL